MTSSTYTTGARAHFFKVQEPSKRVISALTRVLKVLIVIMQISWYAQQRSQALDESQTCLEVRHKSFNLMGKL